MSEIKPHMTDNKEKAFVFADGCLTLIKSIGLTKPRAICNVASTASRSPKETDSPFPVPKIYFIRIKVCYLQQLIPQEDLMRPHYHFLSQVHL